MRIHSPAKVNLSLIVHPADQTGKHPLESLFHMLEFGDTVTIEPADSLSLTCDVDLGIAAEENLAYRAAVAMGQAFGFEPTYAITIEKRIPSAAGLGGGSSNAAAVILGIAADRGIDTADPRVTDVAKSLGADVPVFLAPTGATVMTGYGDEFVRSLDPAAGVPVVLAKVADEALSTAAVYRQYESMPQPPRTVDPVVEALQELVATLPVDGTDLGAAGWDRLAVLKLGRRMFNGLQLAAFQQSPRTADLQWHMADQREFMGVMVAGSGATIFGLCTKDEGAAKVVNDLELRGYWAVHTHLGSTGVRVLD